MAAPNKITRDELETKLRSIQDGGKAKVEETKASLIKIGAGVGIVALILIFLLGQRRGKRKTTLVEIRRL
jgi:hypothetical protein